jgi:hypothetical protein
VLLRKAADAESMINSYLCATRRAPRL